MRRDSLGSDNQIKQQTISKYVERSYVGTTNKIRDVSGNGEGNNKLQLIKKDIMKLQLYLRLINISIFRRNT